MNTSILHHRLRATNRLPDRPAHFRPISPGLRARMRRLHLLASLFVLAFAAYAADGASAHPVSDATLAPGFPGRSPGSARAGSSDGVITVSNHILSATWDLSQGGLRGGVFREAQTGRSLALTGEVFQVVLKDGTRYRASELRPAATPTLIELSPRPTASRLAERAPGRKIELAMATADGRLGLTWRVLVLDEAHYLRQEIEVTAGREDLPLGEVVWMQQAVPEAASAGSVDGSPVIADPFFLGCEDPMAVNRLELAEGRVICRLPRDATLRRGETLTSSFVLGVAPAGQMRRAFLGYLERERAHPYRPYLHYNSWYDTAWDPFALNETNCLEGIRLFGERLIKAHGVVIDGMVFDDGWDDPRTLWQFHHGFPNGFTPLAALCREYRTRLGVWLSPFGGYGEPKAQRLKFGAEQGFETNATGFSLAGPKYYAAFKHSCVNMIRRFGVNHFKFDGIATGMYAAGGAQYVRDTEAMRRLMRELRQEDPDLFINLTTGSWPSPFWLRYADSVWRQGGDMGLAGTGPRQQQWLTYRDQEVYRNIVRKGPLYPLNSLMTQGVAYSRRGSAGDPTFNSAGFKDDVRAFFGSGTGLQELYIQPDRLTAHDWAVLAEAAQWSRANSGVLVDTHWIGGDPGNLEVYGYASWTPRKGIVMMRNPDDQPREFALDVGAAFELPPRAATKFKLTSPWAEDAGKPPLSAESGTPLRLALKPFEIVLLDAVPSLDPVPSDAVVRNAAEFRQAVAQARPGTRILLAPGKYPGGFHFSNLRGETNRPIVIGAADPARPPVIGGAAGGLQLSQPAFVELHDLVISNATVNGLNVDDGGSYDTPAHHLRLLRLTVTDVGPQGNHDAVKLSGVVDFRVEGCVIERWGTGGGSGIDMVGCHRGVIESNSFRHADTVSSTGVQAKGGTSQVIIRRNRFENAGGRAVNIGGSTGMEFFRPPLKPGEAHAEAKDITVEGNTFIGGGAPVAFVGVDGAVVRFNTVYHPNRWALRILQETRSADFVPSRNGVFTDNLVVFHSRDWAEGGVNIGAATAPETFTFARNWWFCLDEPSRSRPTLPVVEVDGVYGEPPLFRDAARGDMRVQAGSPARRVGAEALPD